MSESILTADAGEKLPQSVDETLGAAERCRTMPSLAEFEELNRSVLALHSQARERIQRAIDERYSALAGKLERGKELTAEERVALELLIVGEARYYLKSENSFEDWQAELQRLMAELRVTRDAGIDRVDDLMHIQALCRDARSVLPDILFYLRERERVERFRSALEGHISPEDGKLLARIIRDLFNSRDR